jgi:hypothetical protein
MKLAELGDVDRVLGKQEQGEHSEMDHVNGICNVDTGGVVLITLDRGCEMLY